MSELNGNMYQDRKHIDQHIKDFKKKWDEEYTPKHETVSDWEKRTGEIFPNDGPVWSIGFDSRPIELVEYSVFRDMRLIGEKIGDHPYCIVANHHGKPEDV